SRINGADHEPVATLVGDVPQDAGLAAGDGNQQVQAAVAVQVQRRQAPADVRLAAQRRVGGRDVLKMAGTVVGQELVALGVGVPVQLGRRAHALHAAVDQCQVDGAVI